jgi:2'-hydroxyisoflavone reductase
MTVTRVLILGGTEFVGRAFVDDALARGHDVTTLTRGTRPPQPGVTALHGDRTTETGLAALGDAEWDLVVDTWSWAPKAVTDAAALLSRRAERYVYISSRSVYASPAAGDDETAAVVDADPSDTGFGDYARAKAGGELGAIAGFGDRAILLRAGLVLGPRENIGRLPWWLGRIARGGEVAAPGPGEAELQFIDARDLAAFGIDAATSAQNGAFNVVSEPGHTTMRGLLELCREATGSDAAFRWIPPSTILAAGVSPWTELPCWLPPGGDYEGMHRGDVSRALDAGLSVRPARETVFDTWAWLQSIGGIAPQRADRPAVGMTPEREKLLLES